MVNKAERIAGAIYGTAFGDSWGKDPEFKTYEENLAAHLEFPDLPYITDDTQMSLYSMKAIENNLHLVEQVRVNPSEETYNQLRLAIAKNFVVWLHDPDNDRAPGATCLNALRNFETEDSYVDTFTGMEGTFPDSKGCGANMRVMWYGLLPYSQRDIEILSILQSETTHSHPLALSSAVITALATHAIVNNEVVPSVEGSLIDWAIAKTEELYQQDFYNSNYRTGLQLLLPVLKEAKQSYIEFLAAPKDADSCAFFGEGWVAEQALMNALAVTDAYSESSAVEGIRRLVYTSGDSDSIAAIGGAFLGAHFGHTVFPQNWFHSFEPRYNKELSEVTEFLKEING